MTENCDGGIFKDFEISSVQEVLTMAVLREIGTMIMTSLYKSK